MHLRQRTQVEALSRRPGVHASPAAGADRPLGCRGLTEVPVGFAPTVTQLPVPRWAMLQIRPSTLGSALRTRVGGTVDCSGAPLRPPVRRAGEGQAVAAPGLAGPPR